MPAFVQAVNGQALESAEFSVEQLNAQASQTKNPQVFNVKAVRLELSDGSILENPGEKIAVVLCERGAARLQVYWLKDRKDEGVRSFDVVNQHYDVLKDLDRR